MKTVLSAIHQVICGEAEASEVEFELGIYSGIECRCEVGAAIIAVESLGRRDIALELDVLRDRVIAAEDARDKAAKV